jgi:hypothetical protein
VHRQGGIGRTLTEVAHTRAKQMRQRAGGLGGEQASILTARWPQQLGDPFEIAKPIEQVQRVSRLDKQRQLPVC